MTRSSDRPVIKAFEPSFTSSRSPLEIRRYTVARLTRSRSMVSGIVLKGRTAPPLATRPGLCPKPQDAMDIALPSLRCPTGAAGQYGRGGTTTQRGAAGDGLIIYAAVLVVTPAKWRE